MIVSFRSKDNAGRIAKFEELTGMVASSVESFQAENHGHKFKPGQEVQLVGLEQYPEFNGEIVTITSIRMDGKWGKAYYFKTDNLNLASQLNWTYENRFENKKI